MVEQGVFSNIQKYEQYVDQWRALENAIVSDGGGYYGIFLDSSAMITDSISFVSGYQYVKKPLLFLMKQEAQFNKYGEELLKYQYQCNGDDDRGMEEFIQTVVLGKDDYRKEERGIFYDKYLDYVKINKMNASEKIFHDICENIGLL